MRLKYTKSDLLLLLVLVGGLGIYWPGLYGGFLFDDFPHIVINANLVEITSWSDVVRIAAAGNAGIGGRPVVLLTFALQKQLGGLDPFYFKLLNIFIQWLNVVLVYLLLRKLLGIVRDSQPQSPSGSPWLEALPLLLTAWWALHPMAITSVLYVVQRMTALSATFSLIALIAYVGFRCRAIRLGSGNFVAVLLLSTFTAFSFLAKENGILTLAYALLIEGTLLRWRTLRHPQPRSLPLALKLGLLVASSALLAYVLSNASFMKGYEIRPFTLGERLLTQARVLWYYIAQLLLPNATAFSIYHDDYVTSRGLLAPWTTLPAIAGHLVLMLLAYLGRRKYPLITFGIAWFYLGHTLESSFIPLEMVYEHRNYLPMLGIFLAIGVIPYYCCSSTTLQRQLKIFAAALIAVTAVITLSRTSAWGDALYPIHEAERKPLSSRANFDAGMKVVEAIKDHPQLAQTLAKDAEKYFDRAINTAVYSVAPYIGVIRYYILVNKPIPQPYLTRLEHSLRHDRLHPNVVINIIIINNMAFIGSPQFTEAQAEKLYHAILANPKAAQRIKAHTLFALGLLEGKRGHHPQKLDYFRQAINLMPSFHEFRIMYASALIDRKQYAAAREQLTILKQRDIYGIFAEEEANLDQYLKKLNH